MYRDQKLRGAEPRSQQAETESEGLGQDFGGGFDDEAEFGLVRVHGDVVALNRAGEAALGAHSP
jgi:hypothetical protein